jgi:hypothetical protein
MNEREVVNKLKGDRERESKEEAWKNLKENKFRGFIVKID